MKSRLFLFYIKIPRISLRLFLRGSKPDRCFCIFLGGIKEKKVCQNAPLLSFTHKAPTFTSWGFVIT